MDLEQLAEALNELCLETDPFTERQVKELTTATARICEVLKPMSARNRSLVIAGVSKALEDA